MKKFTRVPITTAFLIISSSATIATVPGAIASKVASEDQMIEVNNHCHLREHFKPKGEIIELRYHNLYRYTDGCLSGQFDKLCRTVAVSRFDGECSDIFYTGGQIYQTNLLLANITLGAKHKIPDNLMTEYAAALVFVTGTVGGSMILIETQDEVVIFVGGK